MVPGDWRAAMSRQALRSNSPRNFVFAASSVRLRWGGKFRPARLIYRFSIDIADRNAPDLRLSLDSADRLSDLAISAGSSLLKTCGSRSSASECAVTSADHFFVSVDFGTG
jgi:hypothetical protein